ncbi:MAG: hypothetical protein AAF585_19715 [Verrucomicrobiota bacterium]
MKSAFIKFIAIAITLAAVGAAKAETHLKTGDRVMLACKDGDGWLSWYSGNWVVLDKASVPGNAGKWIVHSLGKATNGDITIQLKNVHSDTLIDGDNDNSVVLDDDDATSWYIPAKWANIDAQRKGKVLVYGSRQEAMSSALGGYKPIYSQRWRTFGLSNKDNDVQDVVLRSSEPGLLSAKDGRRIYFFFIKAN